MIVLKKVQIISDANKMLTQKGQTPYSFTVLPSNHDSLLFIFKSSLLCIIPDGSSYMALDWLVQKFDLTIELFMNYAWKMKHFEFICHG